MRTLLAVICASSTLLAQGRQTGTISGRVTDARSAPIPNATVRVSGTLLAGSTDADGRFRIVSVPSTCLVTVNPQAADSSGGVKEVNRNDPRRGCGGRQRVRRSRNQTDEKGESAH